MERKGTDEWLLKLAEEEPDAGHLASVGRPPDAEVPAWAGTYWRAWHALRFDRQFGALGGESPISFSALDAYARRYAIDGSRFETFHVLVGAMDDEYLAHVSRVAQANKPKQPEDPR